MTNNGDAASAVKPLYLRLSATAEWLRNGLWFIPAAMVTGAALAAWCLGWVDQRYEDIPRSFEGNASSAQTMLATIAGSTLTMTTLVVSITVVALQLASQQFSPRAMRTFFRDRGTKVALGVFFSTTVYALLVLREVVPAAEPSAEQVPALSITVAFGLMLASLATFLYFLNHVAHAIRAVHIMEAVAAETRTAIRVRPVGDEVMRPDEWPQRPPDIVLRADQGPGSIVGVDIGALVRLAAQCRVQVELLVKVGDYVPSNLEVARVWGEPGQSPELEAAQVLAHVATDRERSMRQDVAFGFRQLVDMAEKALSPGINDPTTAVQALGRIHDLLRRVAGLDDPLTLHRDQAGVVRLRLPTDQWDDLVHLAFDEIRRYGSDSLQIHRTLRRIVADLEQVVADRPDRLEVLALQRDLLDQSAARAFPDEQDRAYAGG